MKTNTLFRALIPLIIACSQTLATKVNADATNGGVHMVAGYGQVPLRFEPNTGQTDPQIRYISRGNGYTMYFAPTETILALDVSTNASRNRIHPLVPGVPAQKR